MVTAAIITIGDELLYGQTIDTNAAWLGEKLGEMGFAIVKKLTIGDDLDAIINALQLISQEAMLVVMTGGLGPTDDDITKMALSTYFDDPLVFCSVTEAHIKRYLSSKGRTYESGHRAQAVAPSRATLIDNPLGTAPGIWIDDHRFRLLAMPGVPYEMKAIFNDSSLPFIKSLITKGIVYHRFVRTAGIAETELAKRIKDIVARFPSNLSIAYLPGYGKVKLRITGYGISEKPVKLLVHRFAQEIYERVEDVAYALGDAELTETLQKLCINKKVTVSTAESCTGGGIARQIVSLSGSSAYFKGSVVAYSNEIKRKMLGLSNETLKTHGAVSEQTVREMVSGVIQSLGTDYAVAVSGIAGPGGGTPTKPVGTIWVAVGSTKDIKTYRLQLNKSRNVNIEFTINLALYYLYKMISDD